MKSIAQTLLIPAAIALLAAACSPSPDSESAQPQPAAPKPAPAPAPAPVPAPEPAPKPAPAPEQVKPAPAATQQQAAVKKSDPFRIDPLLADITRELAGASTALKQSVGDNTTVQKHLQTTLGSLTTGKDTQTIQALQKLSQTKLTPEQTKLAQDFKDAISAYLVHKNFSPIPDSQNQIAQIVTALRKGDGTTAIQSLQQVAQTAQLTPKQKSLLDSLVSQYAPK